MTVQEYQAKYGNKPPAKDASKEQWADWNTVDKTSQYQMLQGMPQYQGPTAQEQALQNDIWSRISGGSGVTPDFNLWRMLSESLGFSPQQIRQFAMSKLGGLFEKPDFGKEYGLKGAELERQWASKASARGLLDSSGAQAALGGGLADLMLGRAGMEENAYMNRLGLGTGLMTNLTGMAQRQGFNKANWLNAQYLQDLGLREQALQYLANQRGQENAFNQGNFGIFTSGGGVPTNQGDDLLSGILGLAGTMAGYYMGGPAGGAGGNQMSNLAGGAGQYGTSGSWDYPVQNSGFGIIPETYTNQGW